MVHKGQIDDNDEETRLEFPQGNSVVMSQSKTGVGAERGVSTTADLLFIIAQTCLNKFMEFH